MLLGRRPIPEPEKEYELPRRALVLRAAAPLRMPPLALSGAGRDARSRHVWVGFAFPGRPQPYWTSPIGGLAPSPLGSPRQECEGTQAQSRSVRICSRASPVNPREYLPAGVDRSISLGALHRSRRHYVGSQVAFLEKMPLVNPPKTATLEIRSKSHTENAGVQFNNRYAFRGRTVKGVRGTDWGRPYPADQHALLRPGCASVCSFPTPESALPAR